MKVIEKGNKWVKNINCKGCKAVLEIETEDLQYEVTEAQAIAQQYAEEIQGEHFVICPECEQKIKIKDVPPVIARKVQELLGRTI